MKAEIERLAFELGLTGDYIQSKAEETLELARVKGINFSLPTLVGFDAQGPQVRIIDANFTPLVNVQKAILAIHPSPRVYRVIISGWDLTTLRFFRDTRLGIRNMGLIGEMGSVFEADGRIIRVNPITEKKHYEMKKRIFTASAEAGLKIAIQGNLSNRVADIYFEGDGPDRGDLKNYFLVKGTDVQIQDLYELIRKRAGFGLTEQGIVFEPTLGNIQEIDWVLGRAKPLTSVRLFRQGEKICLTRDNEDKSDFTLEKMKRFARQIVPDDWEVDPNPDFCVDLIYRGDGIVTSKECTANIFANRIFATGDFVITNVGDKKGDVLIGQNTISFTLMGTAADQYCRENGIPHVSVVNAVDYSLVMAEILNEEGLRPQDMEIEDLFTEIRSILNPSRT